jgi:class 3 adenylate cyclase
MYEQGTDVSWQYMTEVTAGIALNIARASRLDVQPLALWDGLPGRAAGSTESFVDFWRHQVEIEPVIIDMPTHGARSNRRPIELSDTRCEESTMKQQVKSILFADIVGYSKLNERVIPEFVNCFLERVSRLIGASRNAPLSVNTWGDAVYAVFDFAHQAGGFALELAQMIQEGEADWIQKGLFWEDGAAGTTATATKHPLNIRIGLHTGPVFMHYDPIVRRLGFTGAHVNRAARIEPVTKPGEVYASEEFAALAELNFEIERKRSAGNGTPPRNSFYCEYAGTMPLAKKFPGRHRIYRIIPKKPFAVEDLARAAHEAYCGEAQARGETPGTNSSIRPWDELPEDLRDANRAQVADIPNKLQFLGYELAPGHGLHPSMISISDTQLEHLSIREHDRWMKDRLRNGWAYAPQKDVSRKYHHLLIPWEKLSEEEKEKDRDTVRNVPNLVAKAGFRVRKLGV